MTEANIDIQDQELIGKLIQYTDKYKNPLNSKEISAKLLTIPTLGGIKTLVDDVFPDWFVTTIPSYSSDYHQFQLNWISCCKKIGCSKAQIMIVEEIEKGDDYSLIREFAECFTAAGFSVRRKMEFIPCSVCSSALPTKQMYDYMNSKNMLVVEGGWSSKCSTC